MDRVWTFCRFLASVANYYITPTPPDFEVVYAECKGEDITSKLITWLAYSASYDKPWDINDRLVMHYKYKGTGPYIIYYNKDDEFTFPPSNISSTKASETCLVSVEVIVASSPMAKDDSIDITETGEMFAGPDCLWHGRLQQGTLDLKMLYPDIKIGDEIVISFADEENEIRLKMS